MTWEDLELKILKSLGYPCTCGDTLLERLGTQTCPAHHLWLAQWEKKLRSLPAHVTPKKSGSWTASGRYIP